MLIDTLHQTGRKASVIRMAALRDLPVTQWLCVSLLIAIGISGVQSAPVFETDNINRMKEAQDFYQKLENHLARDNTTLFLLKNRIFFQVPSYSFVDVYEFTVCLSVGNNPVTNCSVADALWQPGDFNGSTEGSHYCWDFQWSNSAILGSLTIDLLLAFDNVFAQAIYRKVIGLYLKNSGITLSFHLQSPPCLSETDIEDVLVQLLSWIKAYARSSGRPSSWDKSDKGYISKHYGSRWITETCEEKWAGWAHSIRVALLCAFTFLIVLIPMTLAKYSSWFGTVFKPRLTRSHQLITSVYWGMAITFGVFNLSYLLVSLHKYGESNKPSITACILPVAHPCQTPSGTNLYNDLIAALLVRMILFPITLVVELLIAACTPKTDFPVLCCHFPSVRGMEFLLKVIHTIALWNIFAFIQIVLGVMIIPVCILLFVSPTFVIAYTTLFLFTILYTISTLAALQHFCRPSVGQLCYSSIKRCGIFLFGVVGSISGFGLILVIVLLYFVFTLYGGAHNNGITGVFLSLLPSIVISLVGWFIKKKLYNNATRDATNTEVGHNHPHTDSEYRSDEEMLPL